MKLSEKIIKDFDLKFMDRGNYVYQVEIRDFLAEVIEKVEEETRKEISKKILKELERCIEFDEATDTVYFDKEIDFKEKKEVNNYDRFMTFIDGLVEEKENE